MVKFSIRRSISGTVTRNPITPKERPKRVRVSSRAASRPGLAGFFSAVAGLSQALSATTTQLAVTIHRTMIGHHWTRNSISGTRSSGSIHLRLGTWGFEVTSKKAGQNTVTLAKRMPSVTFIGPGRRPKYQALGSMDQQSNVVMGIAHALAVAVSIGIRAPRTHGQMERRAVKTSATTRTARMLRRCPASLA